MAEAINSCMKPVVLAAPTNRTERPSVRASGVPGLVRHRPVPASKTYECAGHAMHGPSSPVRPRSSSRKSSMSEDNKEIPACGHASCTAKTSTSTSAPSPGSLLYHTQTFSAGHCGTVREHKSRHAYSVALNELGSVATRTASAAGARGIGGDKAGSRGIGGDKSGLAFADRAGRLLHAA